VILGVKFNDGIEAVREGFQAAALMRSSIRFDNSSLALRREWPLVEECPTAAIAVSNYFQAYSKTDEALGTLMHRANGLSSASPRRLFVSAIQTGPYAKECTACDAASAWRQACCSSRVGWIDWFRSEGNCWW